MSDSDSEIDDVAAHAAALKRLITKDPDFYEFLKENDKDLLAFKDSDSEDENQEDGSGDEMSSGPKISAAKLDFIKKKIKRGPTINICKQLISAFKTALHQADSSSGKTDMTNSELFNDIIKLCLIELVPALHTILKISSDESKSKIDPSKSKMWKKVQLPLKSYLIDLLKMFAVMKETPTLILLLKHVIHLVPFYSKFVKLSRLLSKRMISLWCSDEETVRVLSLIVIVRSTKSLPKDYLGQVLKYMYFGYVKNTKFTSKITWPMINFMKQSLAEVYALNPEIAYEHAFIYIRQLAIHLRNAITTKKKESFQTVYNWQYVHCLLLWSHLLCRLQNHDALKTLLYPLVQTIIGTINLIPTAKYMPLRFHLVKALTYISQETGDFIPVLPLILDVLMIVDYNKKSAFSIKPVDFSCSLKVTKSQLLEAGFKDACISEVCSMFLDYLKVYSHTIGFPELTLPAVLQIKNFTKQCKISKYNHQLKAVSMKIEENSLFISEKRRSVNFKMSDGEELKKWEQNVKSQGTPILQIQKVQRENETSRKKQKLN